MIQIDYLMTTDVWLKIDYNYPRCISAFKWFDEMALIASQTGNVSDHFGHTNKR